MSILTPLSPLMPAPPAGLDLGAAVLQPSAPAGAAPAGAAPARPPRLEQPFVAGPWDTPAGPVPRLEGRLSVADRLGGWGVR